MKHDVDIRLIVEPTDHDAYMDRNPDTRNRVMTDYVEDITLRKYNADPDGAWQQQIPFDGDLIDTDELTDVLNEILSEYGRRRKAVTEESFADLSATNAADELRAYYYSDMTGSWCVRDYLILWNGDNGSEPWILDGKIEAKVLVSLKHSPVSEGDSDGV